MTQDVTDDGTIWIKNTAGEWYPADKAAVQWLIEYGIRMRRDPKGFFATLHKLMLAGFCFTLMAGCSLTYKGPQYDLSTLSGLRPEPVRHRETAGMLSQQRDRQRDLLP